MKNFGLMLVGISLLISVFVQPIQGSETDQSYLVLTQDNPNATVSTGESVTIYGTSDANQITVESGADVKLVNFPGSNTVTIKSDSEGFTVSRSGAMVTFQGSDGTLLKIPATISVQTISFNDQTLTLNIYNGQAMLDDQVVTTTAVSIDNGSKVTSECGAYVAPGVWKEFDCYNLAAIGKTTGDDPFTPSWRLIGGYWQWGRKGPDESQWYDTNTSTFAHGPTGSDEADANDDEIDEWSDSYTNNGAWLDDEKTDNDPCPSGYRVPTRAQWSGVNENNKWYRVGTWQNDSTNYNSGLFFGDDLMLPSAGLRHESYNAKLYNRGYDGNYWSSSDDYVFSTHSGNLYFNLNYSHQTYSQRTHGLSVRCIAE